MDVLGSFSDALSRIVEGAGRSVVRVEARRRRMASGIVWAPEGIIVTAQHAVEREDGIGIGLPSGEMVQASLVGADPTTDVAVLRAAAPGLTPADWAAADDARVGHVVVALARPGRTVRAAQGILSAVGEAWRTPGGGQIDRYLQPDVAAYPGFSGGPLVTTFGNVLGLDTTGILRGVVLAVPAQTVRRVVDTILAHGRVRRGYLGVGAHPVRLPGPLEQQLGQKTGLIVVSVEPGGPAERGGLLIGDVVTGLERERTRRLDDLVAFLTEDRIGTTIQVHVVRAARVQDLTVVVGERA